MMDGQRDMTVQEMRDCGTYTKDDIIRILDGRLKSRGSLTPVGTCSPEPYYGAGYIGKEGSVAAKGNTNLGTGTAGMSWPDEIKRDMGIFKKALYDIQRELRKEEDAPSICTKVEDIVFRALKNAGFEP